MSRRIVPPQGGDALVRLHDTHDYHYVVGGEHVLRYCACGKSWMLMVLRRPDNGDTIYVWSETQEEFDEV